ncbi:hypothetical protein ACFL9T_15820 [Thermodesulfobacteriota bacterium]
MRRIGKSIECLLSEVILLQKEYAARICSQCKASCCKRVQYLFDDKDILYTKFCLNKEVPRRKNKGKGGCPFLSPSGCSLEHTARPFICHRYVCATLEQEMQRQEPELMRILNGKLSLLEDLRDQLWKAYLTEHPSSE